mmetsp:Transcript_10952/g.16131  ORF Transcript_10952/g.16131 Transcript_10952/m.16131 type:complete len:263 (+) Transcript_10952:290-1078(+)
MYKNLADCSRAIVSHVMLAHEAVHCPHTSGKGLHLVQNHYKGEKEGKDAESCESIQETPPSVSKGVARRQGAQENVVRHEDEQVEAEQEDVDEEEHKVLLVAGPHAVVHPRAVVVHPHDAAPARHAVVGPWRAEGVASPAHHLGALVPAPQQSIQGGLLGLDVLRRCQGRRCGRCFPPLLAAAHWHAQVFCAGQARLQARWDAEEGLRSRRHRPRVREHYLQVAPHGQDEEHGEYVAVDGLQLSSEQGVVHHHRFRPAKEQQ